MKKFCFALTGLVVILAVLGGCSDFLNPGMEGAAEGPLPGGYSAVRIGFTEGAARTAMPTPVLSSFNRLEYHFTKNNVTEIKSAPANGVFMLAPGTYKLTVKAFMDQNAGSLAAEGSGNFEIKASQDNVDVTINMSPIVSGSGTGKFIFSMTYPSGTTKEIYSLSRISGTDKYDLLKSLSVNTTTNCSGSLTLPVGYYLLQVRLKNGTNAFTGKTEVVHIYQNLETETKAADYNFTAEEFIAETLVLKAGVTLSFDDYFPVEWENHFDLFDKYNAKVTFFISNNSDVTPFMLRAQQRGHEIGFHTLGHDDLRDYTSATAAFIKATISRLDAFRNAGVELTTFAYPYGNYNAWTNTELLKSYKVLRGFDTGTYQYTIAQMKSGFVIAKSIDNYNRGTVDTTFQNDIKGWFTTTVNNSYIINLATHTISTDFNYNGKWSITPARLEIVLKTGRDMGLNFYRYKDLQ